MQSLLIYTAYFLLNQFFVAKFDISNHGMYDFVHKSLQHSVRL